MWGCVEGVLSTSHRGVTFDTVSNRSNAGCFVPFHIVSDGCDDAVLHNGLFPVVGVLIGET